MRLTSYLILVLALALPLSLAEINADDPQTWDYGSEEFYTAVPVATWVEQTNWGALSGTELTTAIDYLENQGSFSDPLFYQALRPDVKHFLNNLPTDKYAAIDAAVLIQAGYGKDLKAEHLVENIDEVTDLKALNEDALTIYLMDAYDVQNVDVTACRKAACTLVDGILKNSEGSVPLNEYSSGNVKIRATTTGFIVEITDPDENFVFSPKSGNYDVAINGLTSLSIEKSNFLVQAGEFRVDHGSLLVLPQSSAVIVGVGEIIAQTEAVELIGKSPQASNKNQIYLGNSLEFTGSGYTLNVINERYEPAQKIRNGFRLQFSPLARAGVPALLKYDPVAKTLKIEGEGKILNGNELVRFQEGHFLATPVDNAVHVTGRSSEGYNLRDLTIFSADDTEKKLEFKDNSVSVGSKGTYFSLEYDERLFGDPLIITQKIGKSATVVAPDVVVIGARTGNSQTEKNLWEYYEKVWLVNRDPNRPTFFINLDKETFSGGPTANAKFVEDLFSSQQNLGQLYYFGHSGYRSESETYALVVGPEADPNGPRFTNYVLSSDLLDDRTVNNPIICGCASGDLVGKSRTQSDPEDNKIIGSYLVAQAKLGKGTYDWRRYTNDFVSGRIKHTSSSDCALIASRLPEVLQLQGVLVNADRQAINARASRC